MRSRGWFKYLSIVFLILVLVVTAVALPLTSIRALFQSVVREGSALFVSQQAVPMALGVAMDGIPTGGDAALTSYANLVGGMPAVAMWYTPITQPFNAAQMDVYADHDVMPMISMGTDNLTPSDAAIASGAADTYLHAFAHAAAAWNKPFFLRIDWEMNGFWYPFSPGQNGNTNASYIAMWQHIVTVIRQDGAKNVLFVYSPNTLCGGCADFDQMYPGNDYVDWVGLDGYNWGTTQQYSTWHSFTQEFATSYDKLIALAPGKPMMIGEVASAEQGGNKAAWITSMYTQEIPARFPLLRLITWFNFNKETQWPVTSSPAALTAFRQVVANPLYQKKLMDTLVPPTPVVPTATTRTTPTVEPTATPAAPVRPTATATSTVPQQPTPTGSKSVTYSESFENGSLDGWDTYDTSVSLQVSRDFAHDSTYSLKISYQNIGSNYHQASVSGAKAPDIVQAGQTVSAYVYVPAGEQAVSAHIYVEDGSHQWHANAFQHITPGQWNLLTYTLSTTIQAPIYHVGVQFVDARGSGVQGAFYIDSVTWQK
jgi:mannan endo-1,4-beta-mannosidase